MWWLLLPVTGLARAFNAALDALVRRGLRKEREEVTRGVLLMVMASMVLLVTSGFWLPEGPRILLLSGMAGGFVAAPIGRRLAYQRGYRNARLEFYISMAEAQKRGMSPREWWQAETEKDMVRFGLQPPPTGLE